MENTDYLNYNELKSLIDLIDDPDEIIYSHIRDKLVSVGNIAMPELEKAWETSGNEIVQHRLEDILHTIQFNSTQHRLESWLKNDTDLLEGFMIISTYQYPQMDSVAITRQIGQITQDVWLELNDNLTALEKIKVLNHVFYTLHNFRGNTRDFYNPSNFYLNSILETRRGSPIGLAIIYSTIAQSLKVPVYGVNLPEHFVLAYMQRPFTSKIRFTPDEVLFYINPFNMGTMFARNELDLFLKQMKVKASEEFFLPCSNSNTIKRVVINLFMAYEKAGELEKAKELTTFIRLIDENL